MKPFPSFFSLLAVCLAFPIAAKADQTWTGAGDALWSNSLNWTSAVPTPADVAIFDATSALNLAAIAGTVKIFDGASLRFSSTSGVNNGGTGTTFDLNSSGVLTTRNSATINLGALAGSGISSLTGSSGATGTTIFSTAILTEYGLTLGIMPVSDPGTNFAIDTATTGQVNLVIVPEPGTVLLGILAGLGLLRRRRV